MILAPERSKKYIDFCWILEGLGSILGAFGSHFEGSGGPKAAVEVQEPPGRGPRATGKGSGRHRVRPGPVREAILVPTWPQHGPILGPKIEQKSVGRRCEKVSIFGWPSGSNLERFWERKWIHVGTQNRSQNGCYLRRADTANHP